MKRNAIFRMILFAFLAVVLVGVLIAGIALKKYQMPGVVVRESFDAPVVSENKFSGKEIDRLKIEWAAGNIVLVPAEGDKISVTEELLGGDKTMVLKKDGSTLYVQYCEGAVGISFGSNSGLKKNLYICVPQDWVCKELEIDAASATVQAEYLTIQELTSSTASGSHTFTNCQVEKLKMETVSGNLDFSGSLDKLDFNGVSAQANLVLSNRPKSINLESVSGDMNLTLPEGCGFTLEKDTVSGRFSSELETMEQNGKIIHGDGSCEIDVEGVSASVHIRKGD